MKYILPFLLILSVGCASNKVQGAQYKSDEVTLIDQSVQMRPLSSEVLRGAYIFRGVETHKINYEFYCGSLTYRVDFSVERKGDNHSVSLESFALENRPLLVEQLKAINKDLKGYHTVGPVGLKCSSDNPDAALSLIVRAAIVNPSLNVYDFENRTFRLSNQDFK